MYVYVLSIGQTPVAERYGQEYQLSIGQTPVAERKRTRITTHLFIAHGVGGIGVHRVLLPHFNQLHGRAGHFESEIHSII